ncbi:MAG: hypothetical protein J7L39_02425 [Candidatus Aenigmarchaeota archaeon]|nr:hypothetical protein [Candidatus Aenigmarchaeota archaeon]
MKSISTTLVAFVTVGFFTLLVIFLFLWLQGAYTEVTILVQKEDAVRKGMMSAEYILSKSNILFDGKDFFEEEISFKDFFEEEKLSKEQFDNLEFYYPGFFIFLIHDIDENKYYIPKPNVLVMHLKDSEKAMNVYNCIYSEIMGVNSYCPNYECKNYECLDHYDKTLKLMKCCLKNAKIDVTDSEIEKLFSLVKFPCRILKEGKLHHCFLNGIYIDVEEFLTIYEEIHEGRTEQNAI